MARSSRPNRAAPPPLPGDIVLMNASAALIGTCGAVLLAATLLLWFVHQPAFALRAIRIDGDVERNSALTIRASALPQLAGNFFTIDLAAGRRAFESVPWVRRAIVRRVWPNRLEVRLEEHRPVALWGDENAGDKLVNSHGEVFEANLGDVEDDDLPTLTGPDGSSAHVWALFGRLAPVLVKAGGALDALELSARGSWIARLDSGAEVELGRGSDDAIVARADRFVATVGEVLARYQRPLEYADLRHHDGYAVRLKGVTTTLATADRSPRK